VANRIAEETAFKWWVSNTLHKRNHIISKVKKKCWQMTHKFGCKLPHSVEEALEIDRQMGTDHWQRALNKEMSKVKGNWLPHCFRYQDGLHKKSKVLCWGTYYRYSSGNDVVKCCFKGQCSDWFYGCSAQWTGCDGL
jgi:hypothetical protein